MRVLWISSSFPPAHGGLQVYNDALSREVAARVEATVVSAPGQRPSARAPHRECGPLAGFRGEDGWARLAADIRGAVADARPDVVHLGHAQMAVVRPYLPATIPVVVSVHGNDLTSPWMEFGRGDLRPRIRAALAGCHLVCVSRHTAGLAEGLEAAVSVLPNACDLERFHPVDFDRAAFRRRLGVPPDGLLVLTTGRIASRKDHLNVLLALRGLDCHWLLAGGGAERGRVALARLLLGMRRRVTMPGWLGDEDLRLAYNAADVFVLTPRERVVRGGLDSEGFGLVYHEAGACGTPSVASDVSGCREAVRHEETGLLVPPRDPSAARAALRRLLTDEPLRRRLGEGALAHVRAQGGWPKVAERLLDLYRSLLT